MNAKLIAAFGVALVAASASFAQGLDSTYPGSVNNPMGKTRAQVLAELKEARANGTLNYLESEYPGPARIEGMPKSRQQVVAELNEFRAAHPNYNNLELDYPEIVQSTPAQPRYAGMDALTSGQ